MLHGSFLFSKTDDLASDRFIQMEAADRPRSRMPTPFWGSGIEEKGVAFFLVLCTVCVAVNDAIDFLE